MISAIVISTSVPIPRTPCGTSGLLRIAENLANCAMKV